MANRWRWLAAIMAAASLDAGASALSVADCFEGSDFIANAALSRENGMSRDAFLNRLDEDFQIIQAFPPRCAGLPRTRRRTLPVPIRARSVRCAGHAGSTPGPLSLRLFCAIDA